MRYRPYNSRYKSDTLYGIRLANRPTISDITSAKYRLVKSIFCLNHVASVGHQPIDSRMNAQSLGSRHTDYESDSRWSVAPQRIDSHSTTAGHHSHTAAMMTVIKRFVAAPPRRRLRQRCTSQCLSLTVSRKYFVAHRDIQQK